MLHMVIQLIITISMFVDNPHKRTSCRMKDLNADNDSIGLNEEMPYKSSVILKTLLEAPPPSIFTTASSDSDDNGGLFSRRNNNHSNNNNNNNSNRIEADR